MRPKDHHITCRWGLKTYHICQLGLKIITEYDSKAWRLSHNITVRPEYYHITLQVRHTDHNITVRPEDYHIKLQLCLRLLQNMTQVEPDAYVKEACISVQSAFQDWTRSVFQIAGEYLSVRIPCNWQIPFDHWLELALFYVFFISVPMKLWGSDCNGAVVVPTFETVVQWLSLYLWNCGAVTIGAVAVSTFETVERWLSLYLWNSRAVTISVPLKLWSSDCNRAIAVSTFETVEQWLNIFPYLPFEKKG